MNDDGVEYLQTDTRCDYCDEKNQTQIIFFKKAIFFTLFLFYFVVVSMKFTRAPKDFIG